MNVTKMIIIKVWEARTAELNIRLEVEELGPNLV
jgi:hypothetical protein